MAELSPRVRALVQPHLAAIEPYDPAFAAVHINLSANESTYPMPREVRAELDRALTSVPLNRYPDPASAELRAELARWHGVDPACVCVGNGGDELLFNFLLAFGGAGRTLVDATPSFSEYAFFSRLTQTAVRPLARDAETFEVPPAELERAAAASDLVILTSPNNPTGNLMPLEAVERACRACPGLVMVDEAYGEFAPAGTSAEALLATCPNLVVLRTLSKAFGAAGIRCGYVIAAPDVIEAFCAVRQIYSVNVLTQAAALVCVRNRAAYAPVVQAIQAERARFTTALEGMAARGVRVWPSAGNFVLVRVSRAARVRERLRDERSILVRDFSRTPGLPDCLRITIGTPAEMDKVLAALSDLV